MIQHQSRAFWSLVLGRWPFSGPPVQEGVLRRLSRSAPVAAAVIWVVLSPVSLRADGWHNAALATASLDEWLSDVKRAIPDLDSRLGKSTLTAGRGPEGLIDRAAAAEGSAGDLPGGPDRRASIQSNLTAEQRALLGRKANDCVEVLAYMHPKNIIPREFPRFQLSKIPEYRKTAKQMLAMMGPEGSSAVANLGLREEFKRAKFGPSLIYFSGSFRICGGTI